MSKEGRITTLNDIQLIQHIWQLQVNSEDELTPQSRFSRMLEEVDEVKYEADRLTGTKDSTERFAHEVADVIFIALGVLSTLGISVEDEMNRIAETNFQKYNPIVNKQLREGGMEHKQAIAHQKRIYTAPKK